MDIRLINDSIFSGNEKAIILTIDGLAQGMEGNVARAFARSYPECWEKLALDIQYPIPLGQCRLYEIDRDIAEEEHCPYHYVIVASTLHHVEVFDENQKIQVINQALISALSLASQKSDIVDIATVILSGGWRLSEETAFTAMTKAYNQLKHVNHQIPKLNIYILEKDKYASVINLEGSIAK